MKKYVAICATLAALTWAGVAAADTPQGQLTGSGTIGFSTPLDLEIVSPVIDGGTDPLYIGKENDKSGNCDGDVGTIFLQSGPNSNQFPIVCAHYVASSRCCNIGSPKMRFAYGGPFVWTVIRITDNGASPDTFASGNTSTLAGAQAMVNLGSIGSGLAASWIFRSVTSGDYEVTP